MNHTSRAAKLARVAVSLVVFLGAAYPLVLWTEAEKEIRILCSMLAPGTTEAEVIRTLETGNLLRYGAVDGFDADFPASTNGGKGGARPETDGFDGGRTPPEEDSGAGQAAAEEGVAHLMVTSPWTLRTLECRLTLNGGVVRDNVYQSSLRLATVAAWTAAAGFLLLMVHQILLALGAPLGHLAWGGRHRILPPGLRVASFLSAVLLALGMAAVLQKAGVAALLPWPGLAADLPWFLCLLFFLSLLGNSVSDSAAERRFGAPLALVLSLACLAVGLAL